MCGIAGISMAPGDLTLNTRRAAVNLLTGIASRGPDATGAAWYDPKADEVLLTKVAVPAWRFIEGRKAHIPEATPTMILHTRFSTHGDKSDRRNNHPVVHNNIMGVHNGVLSNDDAIFRDLKVKRNGAVDSEAIFALLDKGEEHPTKVLGAIRGDAAIGWIDLREPEVLHLANVTGRPLEIAQNEAGSLFFASTRECIESMAEDMEMKLVYQATVPDAKYLKVCEGVILEYMDIDGVVSLGSKFSRQYDWTSGSGSSTKDAATKSPSLAKGSEAEVQITPATVTELNKAAGWDDLPEGDTPTVVNRTLREASDDSIEKWTKGGSKLAKAEQSRRAAARAKEAQIAADHPSAKNPVAVDPEPRFQEPGKELVKIST